MRKNKFSLLLALMLTIGATALPLTAYASGGGDTTPPQITATLDGDTLKVSGKDADSGVKAVYVDGTRINSLTDGSGTVALKDYAGTGKQVSVYAEDYAGNRSETVKFDNPYYEEPEVTSVAVPVQQSQGSGATVAQVQTVSAGSGGTGSQASTTQAAAKDSSSQESGQDSGQTSGNEGEASQSQEESTSSIPEGAFTPEGTGTVQDEATGEDGDKQFYTITTDAGNVFYLIIDGKRDDNNVYFLNGVTEDDLMALAEKSDGSISVIPEEEVCTCTEKCEAGTVDTQCPVCKNDLTGCTGKEAPAEKEEPAEPETPENNSSGIGAIIFVIVALLAVGGIGYYVKIVRPKQQAEDEEDSLDDGYGEGFDPDEAYGETEYLSEDDFDDKDIK